MLFRPANVVHCAVSAQRGSLLKLGTPATRSRRGRLVIQGLSALKGFSRGETCDCSEREMCVTTSARKNKEVDGRAANDRGQICVRRKEDTLIHQESLLHRTNVLVSDACCKIPDQVKDLTSLSNYSCNKLRLTLPASYLAFCPF